MQVNDQYSDHGLCISALEHIMKLISSSCVLLASMTTIYQGRGVGRGGQGAIAPPLQSLSTLCERPAPKIVHLPTTFRVKAYAATCMCKQTAALQPHVPASLCV